MRCSLTKTTFGMAGRLVAPMAPDLQSFSDRRDAGCGRSWRGSRARRPRTAHKAGWSSGKTGGGSVDEHPCVRATLHARRILDGSSKSAMPETAPLCTGSNRRRSSSGEYSDPPRPPGHPHLDPESLVADEGRQPERLAFERALVPDGPRVAEQSVAPHEVVGDRRGQGTWRKSPRSSASAGPSA